MLNLLTRVTTPCYLIIAGRNRIAKQGSPARHSGARARVNPESSRIDSGFSSLAHRPGMTQDLTESAAMSKEPDRPDFHPRSRADRGEPVPRQQPEDELAAGVRRPGDRPGDGGGVPHRRGPRCRIRCTAISSCPAIRRSRSSTRSSGCATARAIRPAASPRSSTASAIFSIMVSFHVEEEGAFDHQDKMPDVPPPEKLTAEEVAKQPMFTRDAGIHPALLRDRSADRTAPGRARPLFRPEDRRRPHQCLDPDRVETARRSGAAHVRAGLCLGFLAARCRDGALRQHAVRQAR